MIQQNSLYSPVKGISYGKGINGASNAMKTRNIEFKAVTEPMVLNSNSNKTFANVTKVIEVKGKMAAGVEI